MVNKVYYRAYALRTHYMGFSQPLFWALVAGFVIAVASYMFFTFGSVAKEFEYKRTADAIQASQAHIAQLETDRAMRSRAIDLDRAHALGYVDMAQVKYAVEASVHHTAMR